MQSQRGHPSLTNEPRLGVVTGATGFIGRSVLAECRRRSMDVRAVTRTRGDTDHAVAVGSIGRHTDWRGALAGATWVIHCAALAHVPRKSGAIGFAEYREVNVEGTRALGEGAAAAGVRRLVYVSSIGVLGNSTTNRFPFHAGDEPAPVDDYAVSKLEAENCLRGISARTGLEVVIVRPPLVYGPGAPGNFRRLMGLILSGVPLPFGCVDNRRSLVGVDNLSDLLINCAHNSAAAGRTFLAADGVDLSTKELVSRLARAVGRQPRLIPVPPVALRLGGIALRRADEVDRLIGSLQVDIAHTVMTLGWRPPVGVEEGLVAAARGFVPKYAQSV